MAWRDISSAAAIEDRTDIFLITHVLKMAFVASDYSLLLSSEDISYHETFLELIRTFCKIVLITSSLNPAYQHPYLVRQAPASVVRSSSFLCLIRLLQCYCLMKLAI